ncbi:MAG TPA: helix-turn-helix domain-containing protein [Microlunatus sp.]|nr:helix-turn-helix domain-containing protein [Microlunatus sp.]
MTHTTKLDDHEVIDCVKMTAGLPRDLMVRFGDKWSLVVLAALFHGPRRFTELHADVGGISHRALTATLRSLQRDGLIRREEFEEMPRRVVYEMTPLGHSLRAPIVSITRWASRHRVAVQLHRGDFDAEQRERARRDKLRDAPN